MARVNQTLLHCVNQMEKTHSKPLAARYGRGTGWARHAMCESALSLSVFCHIVHAVPAVIMRPHRASGAFVASRLAIINGQCEE